MAETQTHEEALRTALKQYWGYSTFRPLQREAMLATLSDRDTLVVLPTGGGKSLCYQAPALCRPGLAVVVSPLISLMKDQVDAARACGISAAFFNSSQSSYERQEVLQDVRQNSLKLLYVAPERITQEDFLNQLASVPLAFIAIDEAHCVSMWGHDFRPHYRELKVLRDRFPSTAMHAFTATATPRVREDIVAQLELRQPEVFVGNFDRHNLTYRVERRSDLASQIQTVLRRNPKESGIIYCITRKDVELWAGHLQALGIRAKPYHAGLDDTTRRAHQEAFIDDEIEVIVATVAFGMGIDKPNVRFVIHTGLPASIENYQQESGRAGRDGLEAECCLFYGGDDVIKWEFMLRDQPEAVRQVSLKSLYTLSNFCQGAVCRHRALVQHFGQDLEQDCGAACDICLGEREFLPDDQALLTSQKILSSIYRQQQRFGMEYTALVLKGSRDQRILANQHEQLSTHGLLKEEPKQLIMDWIGQLVQQGYLQKAGEYNVLQLTEIGTRVLKGERQPRLLRPRQDVETDVTSTDAGGKTSKVKPESWEGVDRELFEHLREVRLEIAREQGVPPYVVFGDAALRDMCRRRPTNSTGFLLVTGVGKQKCENYGERFITEITAWCEKTGLTCDLNPERTAMPQPLRAVTASAQAAFPLFATGLSVEDVATRLGRAPSTTAGYLIDYLREHRITDPKPWVPAELIPQIVAAIQVVGLGSLKPIYLHLNEQVAYDHIRIVMQCQQNLVSVT